MESYAGHWFLVRLLGKQYYLLACLAALLVLLPMIQTLGTPKVLMSLVLTLLTIIGPLSLAARRIDFYAALILGLLMTTLTWVDVLIPYKAQILSITGRGVTASFFLLLSTLLFKRFLFTNREVTDETMIAAVNAYLCIGIMFAFGYYNLMILEPHAFSGTFMSTADFTACVYLSFTTMTTLGYGDITPQTPMAALLCWSQALVGQLFIALTIARIVGVMASRDNK